MSEDARDRMAENPPHRQKTVLVPVDVDEPIVGLVMYLNSIPGVRTQTSCQGGKTYRPQVMVTWTDDAMQRLAAEFDVTPLGDHWSYVHPRTDLSVYDQFAVDPLHTAQAEIGRTNALVYMPGQWRCPKCNFQLTQSNLNAQDGTVTARDTPGDHCPNCNSPLWRVTYREAFKDMMIVAEKALGDAARLRAVVDAARNRQRWILDWAIKTFGPIADDINERSARFVEEAVEAVFAFGLSREIVEKIIARIYSRPAGELGREIGQAALTLEALSASTAREACLRFHLETVINNILDYERVNNLAPTPGRKYCWDSVANATFALSQPSPGAEKLLAVVEAARKLNKAYVNNAINDGWCIAIEYFEGLRNAIAALDAAEGKKTP